MTPKERAAMQQALEALGYLSAVVQRQLTTKTKQEYSLDKSNEAITALREALERSDAYSDTLKECRHCGFLCKPNDKESRNWYPLEAEQAEQVPVAEVIKNNIFKAWGIK